MSASENELRIEVIQAPDWLTAAKMHSHSCFNYDDLEESDVATIQDAKTHAFDMDYSFDIKELIAGPGDCTIGCIPADDSMQDPIVPFDAETDAAKDPSDPTKGFDI